MEASYWKYFAGSTEKKKPVSE
jgi:hypothetical protein